MTCHSCPSALCYDCFPPNFRRFQPDQRFWTDLQKKGWNMNSQKMILFNCNSCLAYEEQRKRQLMHQEDLEAQADARKKQALEEKRTFAEKKRKRESEDARRRLRQVMEEHERSALQRAMKECQEQLHEKLDSLWPVEILESARGKKAAFGCAPLCMSCGFPGHRSAQCPLPKERIYEASSRPAGGNREVEASDQQKVKSRYQAKKVMCSVCNSRSHSRIQCPNLSPEQRREYEGRMELMKQIISQVDEVRSFSKPLLLSSFQQGQQDLETCVRATLLKVLEPLKLEYLIVEAPPPPPAKTVAKESIGAKRAVQSKIKMSKFVSKARQKLQNPMKPKFVSVSDGTSKGAGKGKRATTTKSKLNGAATQNIIATKGEDGPKMSGTVYLSIADGIAAGWQLRGAWTSQGTFLVTYKSPGSKSFLGPGAALLGLEKRLSAQLKVQRDNLLTQARQGHGAKRVLKDHVDVQAERPAKARKKVEAQPVPLAASPSISVSPGQSFQHTFSYGPAVEWILRITVTNAGHLAYTYRRPNGKRWESAAQAASDPSDPAWVQISSHREFMATDIRNRLASKGKFAVPAKTSLTPMPVRSPTQSRGKHKAADNRLDVFVGTPPVSPASSVPGSGTPPQQE